MSVVGRVEVFRLQQWQPVGLRHGLIPGDVVRTGPGSRVAILLSDESQIKINANSTLEITEVMSPPGKATRAAAGPVQTILNLLKGEIWSRSRGRPLQIRTPAATATIRGTEFDLSIGPANESRLAVLEGAVEFRNPQGGVVVKAGEQATARVGEAPSKTLLLNPLDAVQWSLYYPGIVSFRDYPLTGIAPNLLPERLADVEQKVASAPADPEARLRLGEIFFDLGRQVEARREFEKALTLDPRSPRALAGLGWVNLVEGRLQEALSAFQQVTPSPLSALVGQANALYRLDRFDEMEDVVAEAKSRFPSSPQPPTQAALLYLIQGRVAEARQELERALTLDPGYAPAHGLRSNIALVRNERGLADQAAQQAIAANPLSASAYLDQSLVKQAEFSLDEALAAARKALELDPENPMAMIQVGRLLFGLGRLSEALDMTEEARRRAPHDPLITSTWGFLLLTQVKVQEAIAAFDQAIEQDSTRGEPHLGRGLALFRQNKTEEAVREMWMATLLEPKVSLFWSYLGKALYEVKRYPSEIDPLDIAKRLDPKDPTPWFYDAIRKQSVNRPVEALEDLQRSIELNDNRAVYRSRLLLDEDLAARGATLARVYDEVGFRQRALIEGWQSLNVDPTDYSAHRFLSDSYAALPRHEIARVSELLQSQLLQPISISPVQPQLAESELFILGGSGPADPSMNEFNPLFVRDRFALLVSGTAGEQDTLGNELVQSGIWGPVSYSLGQYHNETDGFRKNNDLNRDVYNAFVQASFTPNTSAQIEYRFTDTVAGDRDLRFLGDLLPDLRQERETQSVRLGLHHAFSSRSDLIASFIYKNVEDDQRDRPLPFLGINFALEENGYLGEVQHLFRTQSLNVISGFGHLIADIKDVGTFEDEESGGRLRTVDTLDVHHTNLYVYSQIHSFRRATVTVGVSTDFFKGVSVDRDQVNPKLGVTYNPLPNTTLRAAIFRTLKRRLISDQTIEPTQVAGFNQFFDDGEGTDAWRYGVGIDQRFSPTLYGGTEVSKRDLEVPFLDTDRISGLTRKQEVDWNEYLA
ncbi:tetratricopeptide repeat protein, partial [Candidatus Methylomirabilis sp.]|uniref:tetratricopeptide repeat protein n=1 Tax=Candidatus Methylomirabilis sp. TaxID=2032687 RepID=UPI0030767ACA